VLGSLLNCSTVLAEEHAASHAAAHFESAPHHLSLLLANTRVNGENETGFTVGVDYQYRLNQLLGMGAVVERMGGKTQFAGRIGLLYEVELPSGFTVSPQFHFQR